MIKGLFLALAKIIAVKIVERKYPIEQRTEKSDEINEKANALMPLIGIGMAIVLIVVPLAICL